MGSTTGKTTTTTKTLKKASFFASITEEKEENHPEHQMMIWIMILLLVLGTTIPLSMKKKVKISMTNPLQQGKQQPQQKTLKKSAFFDDHRWYRGKPPKISNDE